MTYSLYQSPHWIAWKCDWSSLAWVSHHGWGVHCDESACLLAGLVLVLDSWWRYTVVSCFQQLTTFEIKTIKKPVLEFLWRHRWDFEHANIAKDLTVLFLLYFNSLFVSFLFVALSMCCMNTYATGEGWLKINYLRIFLVIVYKYNRPNFQCETSRVYT